MPVLNDLSGKVFERLTVIKRAPNKGECVMWLCKCSCGNFVTVRGNNLVHGITKSCGCFKKDKYKLVDHSHSTHNESGTPLYGIWRSMKARCYNAKHKFYKHYGGRGIAVCDEWKDDYLAFSVWAKDNGYKDGLSIERIDNNKGYSPSNCMFIPKEDQPKHRRTNHIVNVNGENMTIAECSRRYGIPTSTITFRANRGRDIFKRERRW